MFILAKVGGLPLEACLLVSAVLLVVAVRAARLRRSQWLMTAAVTFALALPLLVSAFDLAQIGILMIGALGLVVLSGYTGQISVAQGTFVGVGAYVTAVLGARYHVPLVATLPLDVLAGAAAGAIIGVPSARLRGIYQVMTTLAVAVAFPPIIVDTGSVFGGSAGLPVGSLDKVAPHIGGAPQLGATLQNYLLCLACTLFVLGVLKRLFATRHGTAMRAIRENEVVAAVNGIAVAKYRIAAFVLSAAIAALAGGLSAITIGAVSPDSFGLLYSIEFLVIIAVGGSEQLSGALVGAIVVFLITTGVQGIHVPSTNYTISDEVVYGIVVIVVLLVFRGGLAGAGTRALAWLDRRVQLIVAGDPTRANVSEHRPPV